MSISNYKKLCYTNSVLLYWHKQLAANYCKLLLEMEIKPNLNRVRTGNPPKYVELESKRTLKREDPEPNQNL